MTFINKSNFFALNEDIIKAKKKNPNISENKDKQLFELANVLTFLFPDYTRRFCQNLTHFIQFLMELRNKI